MTVAEALGHASARLAAAGIPTPGVDAELLLAHTLALSRTGLVLARDRALSAAERERLDALLERRERREPLAYVLGEWGFRRLTLKTDRRALVPRPETEVVVERCLARVAAVREPRILDVGVGSGAIALALADEHPGARVTAIDVSADALALARENAAATGLAGRIELERRDAAAGLPRGPFDLVVSNPPYIDADELGSLQPEVRDWEPRVALVGGHGPSAVARAAAPVLRPGGALVLEVGAGQARGVARAVAALGYGAVTITSDLTGCERVVEATAAE